MGVCDSEMSPFCAQTSLGEGLITAGAQLVELDLSDNAFGPDGVRGFEALLKSSACFTLHELKLNNCGMGIGGGKVGVAGPPACACCPSPVFPPCLVSCSVCIHWKYVPLATIWDGWVVVFLFRGERPQRQLPVASGERRWRPGGRGCQATVPRFSVLSWQHRGSVAYMLDLLALQSAGLGHPRLAVPLEQLAEPREAQCVHVGEGTQEEKLLGPGHSSPSSWTGSPPVLPTSWAGQHRKACLLFPEPVLGEPGLILFSVVLAPLGPDTRKTNSHPPYLHSLSEQKKKRVGTQGRTATGDIFLKVC